MTPLTPPTPSPGQVWWAAPSPTVGREQQGRRPVLLVSSRSYHQAVTTLVLAVPLTTTDRGWPNHIPIDAEAGLREATWAMTEQVRAISRDRLERFVGVVAGPTLAEIRQWITDYLID